MADESLQLLGQYPWPGNIRELENALERAIILADMENNSVLNSGILHLCIIETTFN